MAAIAREKTPLLPAGDVETNEFLVRFEDAIKALSPARLCGTTRLDSNT